MQGRFRLFDDAGLQDIHEIGELLLNEILAASSLRTKEKFKEIEHRRDRRRHQYRSQTKSKQEKSLRIRNFVAPPGALFAAAAGTLLI